MKSILEFSLKDKTILRLVYNFAKAKKIKPYLVGGILRDLLLDRKKENPDFDFCLKRGAISSGKKLAGKIKCKSRPFGKGRDREGGLREFMPAGDFLILPEVAYA